MTDLLEDFKAMHGGKEPSGEELEAFRHAKIQKIIEAMSFCNSVLDLPVESFGHLLKIKPDEVWKLVEALRNAEKLSLTNEELSHILDVAKVKRIMDDTYASPMLGPTGPTGATGCTGPIGVVG